MIVISLNNLWYFYPGSSRPVLKGVGFRIRSGERVALLGANGSGKSTLLNCINGLVPAPAPFPPPLSSPPPRDPLPPPVIVYDPSGGALNPADEEDLEKIRRRFGTVLQNPDDQIISSIVEDDTAFGPENLGLDREEIKARVAAALKRCGLENHRDRPPQFLSGGERQRLVLAGVLAMDPDIIALDEAVSMLDPKGRENFLALLDELSGEGKTIIQVTHDLEEAFRCGRCLVLYRGRLVFDGPPAGLLEREELEDWGFVLPEPFRALRLFRGHFPSLASPGGGEAAPWSATLSARAFAARLAEALPKHAAPADAAAVHTGAGPAGQAAVARAAPADTAAAHTNTGTAGPAAGPDAVDAAGTGGAASVVSFEDASHVYFAGTPFAVPGMNRVGFELGSSGTDRGRLVALVGRSGSGKSTVLRHINALLLPTGGRVCVLGNDTRDRKVKLSVLREQAILSVQNPESALFERYLADDIAFGPKNSGLRGPELIERVRSAMDKTGLSFADFSGRETRSLSGGEKRRAALAGIAAMESGILLLDEPLAALDGTHQKKILAMIREFREQGKTIIISTHSMETAAAADLVGVMTEGTLAAFGPPREIFGPAWEPRWGLTLPWAAEAARGLAQAGCLPPDAAPLTAEELADLALYGRVPAAEPSRQGGTRGRAREKTPAPGRPRRKTGVEFFRPAAGGFLGRPSVLLNLGAGTKFLFLVALAAAVLAAPGPFVPLGVLIGTLAGGRFAGRVGPLYLLRGLVPLAPWLVILGGLSLAYTGPRFDYIRPLALIVRAAALVTMVSLYSAVTSPGEILRSVNRFFSCAGRFCLPRRGGRGIVKISGRDLSLAAGITARFVPVLTEEAERIVTAQLSRGGKKSRPAMAVSMIIPLFLRALERAEILAKAIMLRGYR
ncbi:MAG: ATP-binding cassette domain-containing protein, partial [Treponema sp.]|nr:ATP-binding cassette domain-containing protein [Treponema sp.]